MSPNVHDNRPRQPGIPAHGLNDNKASYSTVEYPSKYSFKIPIKSLTTQVIVKASGRVGNSATDIEDWTQS
jgi:hypothetical protein